MTAPIWCVRVNEVRVYSVGRGTAWWFWYRRQCEPAGRILVEDSTFIGDQVKVLCGDQDHAEWLAGYMQEQGIPQSAVTVVRA